MNELWRMISPKLILVTAGLPVPTMPSKGAPLDAEDQTSGFADSVDEREEAYPVYYPSNIPGAYAVNAMTGSLYPYKTGSLESLQLFRVTDSTGTVDRSGQQVPVGVRVTGPNQLFYSSPAEYADHRGVAVDPAIQKQWTDRMERISPKGVFHRGAAREFTKRVPRPAVATGD